MVDIFIEFIKLNLFKETVIGFYCGVETTSESPTSFPTVSCRYPYRQFIFCVAGSFFGFSLNHIPHMIINWNLGGWEAKCLGWCGNRNFLTGNTGFSCLCDRARIPVAKSRVFQQLPSRSRSTLPPPGTWCRPLCWICEWRHNVPIAGDHPNTMMWIRCLLFINMNINLFLDWHPNTKIFIYIKSSFVARGIK